MQTRNWAVLTTFIAGVALGGCAKRAPSAGSSFSGSMGGGGALLPAARSERYAHTPDSAFLAVADAPVSTFSADVDTGAYSNTRRFLTQGSLPPVDAVRIEELINYFDYAYPEPAGPEPLAAMTEVAPCPWNTAHQLVHIGVQGKHVRSDEVPPRNLVFLVDTSGSMQEELGLLRLGLSQLASTLREQDHVSIVVYAGDSGVALEPTHDKQRIHRALRKMRSGGSTNGEAGIHLAYAVAQKNFHKGAINRVILATDGDFNVGQSSDGELVRIIEEKRKSGVYLSVLGFGQGNVNESMMEQLADRGNGNYAYIDSAQEAERVLVDQANATLVPIADDVKLQVEFNPTLVEAYRLVGYENRALGDEDFNDDQEDAGDVGAGHTVTALYEIVPAGAGEHLGNIDPLVYQAESEPSAASASAELMTVKIRYKHPGEADSEMLSFPILNVHAAAPSQAFRFSAAVASFGMLLRDSPHKGSATFASALALAEGALGQDEDGARREFLNLVRTASALSPESLARAGG